MTSLLFSHKTDASELRTLASIGWLLIVGYIMWIGQTFTTTECQLRGIFKQRSTVVCGKEQSA